MLKPDQYFTVRWNPANRKHYESLGYIFTRSKDEFVVPVEHIPVSSRTRVKVICDYCGKGFEMYMYAYTKSTTSSEKVACGDCKVLKTIETMKRVYGVDNCLKIPEVQSKCKKTLKDRYGVTTPLCSQEILAKAQQTCKKNYGTTNSMKSSVVREKAKATIFEKYGVDNIAKSEKFVEKAKATCVERYGGESSQCSPEVRQKSFNTLLGKDGIPSSKAEKEMVSRLIEIYGKENCHPQYLFSRCAFDCLLTVGSVKIDVEYDGIFWHKDKQESDKRRDFFAMKNGYKVLRFKSNGNIPTHEQIKQGVNYLVNSEHRHLIIDI